MAQLKDVFEIELNRDNPHTFGVIHLFPEGTFYRAYEWSAWLCCRYLNQFKATRREQKSVVTPDGTVVFIGFPMTSLSKYTPEGAQMTINDDKSVTITLSSDSVKGLDDAESLAKAFTDWKSSVPMAAPRKESLKEEMKNMPDMQPHRMSDIMLRIIAFPIEQKTPMECMNFIAEIKQQLASLL